VAWVTKVYSAAHQGFALSPMRANQALPMESLSSLLVNYVQFICFVAKTIIRRYFDDQLVCSTKLTTRLSLAIEPGISVV
jgi:hypothetical protein